MATSKKGSVQPVTPSDFKKQLNRMERRLELSVWFIPVQFGGSIVVAGAVVLGTVARESREAWLCIGVGLLLAAYGFCNYWRLWKRNKRAERTPRAAGRDRK